MRIEIFYTEPFKDGRAERIKSTLLKATGIDIPALSIIEVFLLEGMELSREVIEETFADPIAQHTLVDSFACEQESTSNWNLLIEVTYKPGVTDPVALTARDALRHLIVQENEPIIQTSQQYLIDVPNLYSEIKERITGVLYNPLIQMATVIERREWIAGERPPSLYPHSVTPSSQEIQIFQLDQMEDEELVNLSEQRLLALSTEEMKAIQKEFQRRGFLKERADRGLPSGITDVELEMIAQTWSEHCKHKIFNARILYIEDGREETIESIFETYIRKTTDKLADKKEYLKSVFHDNSGVIKFDEESLICFKVETHNSPSALDPYGGAITGIVGVNRDIIGTGKGARPIFNTNILCFGLPDTPTDEIPKGLLPPQQVMEGVHRGIIDGGNQSGIPVVGGAFLFDESYLGKPLVFCGTGGVLPLTIGGEEAWMDHVDPGDLAVMVGGRIGKDGIHGATFSSQALDEQSPTSAVQIGDPITQKKMLDFLMEARDQRLYKGITDNGAGGLSSSLGEMSVKSGGVRIDLDKCPLKYSGLAPWEILLSESQERMSLAVHPDRITSLLELAAQRDVGAAVVGRFTDTGRIEIYYENRPVGFLTSKFLHDGLPVLQLEAHWRKPDTGETQPVGDRDVGDDILKLLSDPNIASKEDLVRQYDHEVQARSVVKPFVGAREDGPSDGAVLRVRPESVRGITITHGICPRYGDYDAYHMAMCAVDEAFRAHIACGGDPDLVSALDNFSWPDPVHSDTNPDGHHKLAQLVRACKGLEDCCSAYGLPIISGKDSMKNDAFAEGRKISVRPTLLISLLGVIGDVRKSVSTDFKNARDGLFLLGETRGELGGSSLENLLGVPLGPCPEVRPQPALGSYRRLHEAIILDYISSCHDLSDGGLAVSLCESALGGRLGAEIDLQELPGENISKMETHRLLFCETPSRLLISAPEDVGQSLLSFFEGHFFRRIGKVLRSPVVRIKRGDKILTELDLSRVMRAWQSPFSRTTGSV
jgi:phosphoribosylformylglycinamidine synthase